MRHRQTKESATARLHLNHRATSRLYCPVWRRFRPQCLSGIITFYPQQCHPDVLCHPERSEGSAVAFEIFKMALLPVWRQFRRSPQFGLRQLVRIIFRAFPKPARMLRLHATKPNGATVDRIGAMSHGYPDSTLASDRDCSRSVSFILHDKQDLKAPLAFVRCTIAQFTTSE